MNFGETPRTPPAAVEAEALLLACILLDYDGGVLAKTMEAKLTPSAFFDPRHSALFGQILDLKARNLPVDALTLIEENRGKKNTAIEPLVVDITRRIDTTVNHGYFLQKVCDAAQRRALLAVAQRTMERCYESGTDTVEEISAALSAQLLSVLDTRKERKSWQQAVAMAKADAEEVIRTGKPSDAGGISWGFPSIDNLFTRLMPGEMAAIAARPGMGKSSFMRQMARANAASGTPVAIFSLEVLTERIAKGMAIGATKIPYRKLQAAHEKDKAEFLGEFDSMAKLPIYAFDGAMSMMSIETCLRMAVQRHHVRVAFIDYLTLIEDCDKLQRGETQTSAIGRVTKALKRIANELGIVIVILCQLNRKVEHEANREPRLHDLRSSGDIEQDCDRVVFIHRPDEDPLTKMVQNNFEVDGTKPTRYFQNVLQKKGRDQGEWSVATYFHNSTASFAVAQR